MSTPVVVGVARQRNELDIASHSTSLWHAATHMNGPSGMLALGVAVVWMHARVAVHAPASPHGVLHTPGEYRGSP